MQSPKSETTKHCNAMFAIKSNRSMLLFVKTRDMRVGFYTPTQPPWAASGIPKQFLRNCFGYIGGIGYPL